MENALLVKFRGDVKQIVNRRTDKSLTCNNGGIILQQPLKSAIATWTYADTIDTCAVSRKGERKLVLMVKLFAMLTIGCNGVTEQEAVLKVVS